MFYVIDWLNKQFFNFELKSLPDTTAQRKSWTHENDREWNFDEILSQFFVISFTDFFNIKC